MCVAIIYGIIYGMDSENSSLYTREDLLNHHTEASTDWYLNFSTTHASPKLYGHKGDHNIQISKSSITVYHVFFIHALYKAIVL